MIKRFFQHYREDGLALTVGRTAGYLGKRIERAVEWIVPVLKEENLPLYHRLRAIYYSIDVESYVWLDMRNGDPTDYFTYQKMSAAELTEKLNADNAIVDNDLVFNMVTRRHTDRVPEIVGVVHDGVVYSGYGELERVSITERLDEYDRLFLKPASGSEGENLYSVVADGDDIYVNDDRVTERELEQFVHGLDDYIVQESITQHEYAERIYPHTTNTLRVITGFDPVENRPFIFSATHRFGSRVSRPVDNRSQGGYVAPVDVETGELKRLVRVDDSGDRNVYASHPETSKRVAGRELPFWDDVRELVEEVSRIHNQLSLVGWDVVITPEGPVVIEGNSVPKSILGQLERGYFEDERMKRVLDTS